MKSQRQNNTDRFFEDCINHNLSFKCLESTSNTIPVEEYTYLVNCLYSKTLIWDRAFCILAHIHGVPIKNITRIVHKSRATIYRHLNAYKKKGIKGVENINKQGSKPYKRNNPKYVDAIFSILHSPPSSYDINRSTWRLKDIKKIMEQKRLHVSEHYISKTIKDSGYVYRKSRTVLTSNDPDYRNKLKNITKILSKLKPTEKFFSIDEYGPFSVKAKGGTSLVKKGHFKTVQQWQKSKGWLIVTAALELSTNQVTHMYSRKKNTAEMIRLLNKLYKKYHDQETIYLSWDAASWHVSKKLYEKINEINESTEQGPIVKIAPLPARAQFLNVIESVYSGMAKAIIHNSDYQSVDECKKAINRYFKERNQYFKKNPKRAGNKIWGKEIVKPVFSESNNCKDPRYR